MSKKNLLLILLILFTSFLRFFKLSDYPIQLNHDEVSQIYDTASIVQTGKDIYGNFLPLAFPSTGDYKPGHYIYISTISYLLFGDREITIRIPAAFFGTLTVLGVFLFIKALTKNWTLAFLSAILVSITPSEIFYSRKSFENVIGVCLVFLGLFCLLNSLEKTKGRLWNWGASFFLASAMYVYTSHTIVVPLSIILFGTIFRKKIKLASKKFSSTFLIWLILITPLIFLNITNPNLRFRAASVFITQDANLGRYISLTGSPIKAYIDYIFTRYLNQFNPVYIFANGLDLTNQGFLGIGPLLLWQLPFLVLGAVFLVKKNSFSNAKKLLFGLVALAMIPSAITFESFSPHRAMLGFTTLSIISAFGLYWLIQLIPKLSIFILLFGLLVLNFTYFVRMYAVSYPYEKSQNLHYPFKQVAQFAWSQYNNFDAIVFDPQFGEVAPVTGVGSQYYLAYYGHYPPAKLQRELRLNSKKGEIAFDKFSIRQVIWAQDQALKNTLIIASPWSIPIDSIDKNSIIKRFNFYNGHPAFYAIKL